MNNFLISTVAAINIFLAPVVPQAIPVEEPKAEVKIEKKHEKIKVEKGDALAKIAEAHYGESDYWVTIWNDNGWIGNPSIIEKEWKLKIRIDKPQRVEELKPELSEKIKEPKYIAKVLSEPKAPSNTSQTQPSIYAGGPLNDAQIQFLGNCESGMTATRNSGNGYYGAFQFSIGTWNSMGTGYARADMATLEVQIDTVQRLVSRSSIFTQFPGCARQMRSQGII